LTDPTRVRRPRPVLRAIGAVVAFYVLGFLLVALFLIPFAKYLTRGASAEQLAAHPTPLFALGQGVALLLGFGLEQLGTNGERSDLVGRALGGLLE